MDYSGHERDFTEEHYRELLRLAKKSYRFAAFTDPHDEWTILWRHDIDMSPHRARALARIEEEEGVRATYFVLLHSEMYNALEAEVAQIIREIAAIGHDIGLHFDPSFYSGDQAELEPLLRMEKVMLETALGVPIHTFSWHNPNVGDWIESTGEDRIGGMVNAYGKSIRDAYSYVSDSHGVWRFRRLHDVLAAAEEPRLHVLTHAEWWVPEALPPRARVSRAIAGRAARTERFYDEALAAMGRPNIR